MRMEIASLIVLVLIIATPWIISGQYGMQIQAVFPINHATGKMQAPNNHLGGTCNVMDYANGATINDGSTDAVAAFTAAYAAAGTGGTVYVPNGTYLWATGLQPAQGANLVGDDNSVIVSDAPYVLKMWSDTDPANTILRTTLDGAVANAALTIALADDAGAAGARSGDLVIIRDGSRQWQPGESRSHYGETNRVARVSGRTLTLLSGASTDYPNGAFAVIARPWTFRIANILFRRLTKTSNTATALAIARSVDSVIEHVAFDGFGATAAAEGECHGNHYNRIAAKDLYYEGVDLGYGVQTTGSTSCIVEDSTFTNCRRGVDFSGAFPSRFCAVVHCRAEARSYGPGYHTSGFGDHSTAEHSSYSSCTAVGTDYGLFLRGNYEQVSDFVATGVHDVIVSAAGKGRHIDGVRAAKTLGATNDDYPAYFYEEYSNQALAGASGIGSGSDGVVLTNCLSTYSAAFLYLGAGVLSGMTFEISNCDAGRQSGGPPHFIMIAAQASPATYTFYLRDVRNHAIDGSGLIAPDTSVGANATAVLLDAP